RGAAPIQQAIIDGEKETGITIMRTVKAVDAGDMLLQRSVTIGKKETAGELFDRLAILGGELIVEAVQMVESGKAVFTPQNHEDATHCRMISKADGKIDFSKSAEELDCFVRGMTPWPSAYTYLDGKLLKVFEVEAVTDAYDLYNVRSVLLGCTEERLELYGMPWKCGMVLESDSKCGLVVAVGSGLEFVRLKQIQLEGAKRMSDVEFLRGRNIEIGTQLG
ncbi:MAG: methionyl-tRNA formyltransferase, partial [Clostridiales bacterium]|nr:methionyl-tRNA formyltransferase [Clostridiales bacterium]